MRIEYDPAKRAETLVVRNLDMAQAGSVFDSANVTIADTRFDYGELRFMTVGYLDARMVVVIWTLRNSARRIISLRKANAREQATYYPSL